MKHPAKNWLPERVNLAGVLASGLRRPNGKFSCQCSDASCPPDRMEKVFRQLTVASALFVGENPLPRWFTFTFEHGQIRLVIRADGWMFAVAVRPETEGAQNLDAFAAEFFTLDLT